MLSLQQIEEVKQEFIEILSRLKTLRADSDVDGLVKYLESINFFNAPASLKYHCSFPGGLCLHSINVYNTLKQLAETYSPGVYSEANLIIVGLLHDVIRADLFEENVICEKVYSNYGKKKETVVNPLTNEEETKFFDWETSLGYKTKDADSRMTFGSRGFATYYIISGFIPLTQEETITLVNQYNAFDNSNSADISTILSKYNLSVYLHAADTICTYCIEK